MENEIDPNELRQYLKDLNDEFLAINQVRIMQLLSKYVIADDCVLSDETFVVVIMQRFLKDLEEKKIDKLV